MKRSAKTVRCAVFEKRVLRVQLPVLKLFIVESNRPGDCRLCNRNRVRNEQSERKAHPYASVSIQRGQSTGIRLKTDLPMDRVRLADHAKVGTIGAGHLTAVPSIASTK
jgi:hypothetical protein